MALYFMFTYITTTTIPSFPALQEDYAATLEQINWTVAIPGLGLAVGPLFCSSLADIIGRRPIFIIGTAIALAATIGAAVATSYSSYMVARFFQGLGASPASNVGLAILNDCFFEHERGQKVGLWVLAIDLGLLSGPLIGGFVCLAGHKWIQWLAAIIFGIILVCELVFLPETLYPRNLMLSKTNGVTLVAEQMEEKVVGNKTAPRKLDVPRTKALLFANVTPLPGIKHPKLYETLIRFLKTFKYAVVPISVITYCFGWYWWVISVATLIPVAYGELSPQDQGLRFTGLIVGTLVSELFFSGRLSDWLIVKLARRNNGLKTPEMRIWLAYPAAVLTAAGLIVWGVSVDRSYHWVVDQIAFAFFGAGIQMGNTAVCSYILDAYPMQTMAIMTFYSVMLNLSAFINPFFIVPWVQTAGFSWTLAGQAIVTLFFCIPVLALVHRFGEHLRQKTGTPTWVNSEYDSDSDIAVAR